MQGLHPAKIGEVFLNCGFAVELVMWFEISWWSGLSNEMAVITLEGYYQKNGWSFAGLERDIQRFLQKGGTVCFRKVWSGELQRSLKSGNPPITVVDYDTLYRGGKTGEAHAVIPVGMSKHFVFIQDPNDNVPRHKISKKRFFKALNVNDQSVLFIKPN